MKRSEKDGCGAATRSEQKWYINGIGDTAEQTYGANYTPENYQAVSDCEGHQYEYAVWFGASGTAGNEVPDGHYGKFSWTGDVSAGVNGGGVNEAVAMSITCTPSTVIVFAAS